jgi:GAF domain-containing protein
LWTKDAKLVPALPQSDQIETSPTTVNTASLSNLLDVLVRTAIRKTEGEARAAFYVANGATLHHVTGMPEAYAKCVDGFAIGPESLACGLAASSGQPIITRDVVEEPLWQPWLWLAKQFDYRACWSFPVRNSAGKIVGTFAMYYKEPREATQRDLDVAATITTAAGAIIARQ